jgi:hypothetical protein
MLVPNVLQINKGSDFKALLYLPSKNFDNSATCPTIARNRDLSSEAQLLGM